MTMMVRPLVIIVMLALGITLMTAAAPFVWPAVPQSPASPPLRDLLAAQVGTDDLPPEDRAALMSRPRPDAERDPRGCLAWDAVSEARWRYLKADAMLRERDKRRGTR